MKKKTTIFWAIVLMALSTFQCTTEDDDLRSKAPDLHSQDPELYEYLSCQGFDVTDAELYDEHVVVEGDISIRLDVIRAKLADGKRNTTNGRTSQFVTNTGTVVTFNNVLDISYFIENSVQPISGDWEAAIRTATQGWEDMPYSRIGFTELSTAVNAELRFYADNHGGTLPDCARNLQGNALAKAEFSGGGQPGRWIFINDNGQADTQAEREAVIRHELGHVLGFRHDNPISGWNEEVNYTGADACGNDVLGANHLAGTPGSDGSSIMIPDLASIIHSVISYCA